RPWTMLGALVYQTQDTPLAQTLKAQYPHFYDYVLLLDTNKNVTTLYKVEPTGVGNVPAYVPNPEVIYIQSILDGQVYNIVTSKDEIEQQFPPVAAQLQTMQLDIDLSSQIDSVIKFTTYKTQYG